MTIAVLGVFAATIFLGSALFFVVQPLIAKVILPLAGGTPAAWNTCVVFFQASLLAGYLYAHLATARSSAVRQVQVHLALLLVAWWTLPFSVPSAVFRPPDANLIGWLLKRLFVMVGLPAFALSANALLLQRWFSTTSHHRARDPYFLYVASNAGSLLALLSYPSIIEPSLRLQEQSRIWATAWGALMVLTGVVAVLSLLGGRNPAGAPRNVAAVETADRISPRKRMRWLALAGVPSALMLAVTGYLSTDVAPVPLLWVLPLGLYLLSFIVAFSRSRASVRVAGRALPLLILPLAILMARHDVRLVIIALPLHLIVFFVAALTCHAQLADERPPPTLLTEFYVWIAIGGILGSLCVTLLAPLIFTSIAEYPLALVFLCLLRPLAQGSSSFTTGIKDVAFPLALGVAVVGLTTGVRLVLESSGSLFWQEAAATAVLCASSLVCFSFSRRRVRFALGVGLLIAAGTLVDARGEHVLHRERTFFGVYRVAESADHHFHSLSHGTTLHGLQSLDPARRREPLTYYHRTGPVGQVLHAWPRSSDPALKVAVVGLGAGSMAAYAQRGQQWTFYELDPAIERIARDSRYFSFLPDCLGRCDVTLGDARLSLVRAPAHIYDLIAIDAFNSDAIPIHLLTEEALRLYRARLAASGLLLVHVSNRHLRLQPVIARLVQGAGLAILGEHDGVTSEEVEAGKSASQWLIIAAKSEDLRFLNADPRWLTPANVAGTPLWTDDFSNIWSVFVGK